MLEVAHVWLWKGDWGGDHLVDDQPCAEISAYLECTGRATGEPFPLLASRGRAFQGSIVLGEGFLLSPPEVAALLEINPLNADVLRPYLSGEDLNGRIDQTPSRWVIQFDERSEDEARGYPEVWAIAEKRVYPERKQKDAKKYPRMVNEWWKHWNNRRELALALRDKKAALAITLHAKHSIFSPVDPGWIFSHGLAIVATDNDSEFAVLSSAPFAEWAHRYGGTLGRNLRFSVSDCFENYPFPKPYMLATLSSRNIADSRRAIMHALSIGITKLYNLLHDPNESSTPIQQLRAVHVELDRLVVAAYGWSDIELDHQYRSTPLGERFAVSEMASKEILARLLELNHRRHAEEVAAGLVDEHGKSLKPKGKRRLGKGADTPHANRTAQPSLTLS